MSDRKTIAVIGATGAQGGGLVRAILADALPGEPLYGFTPDAGPMLDYSERLHA